LLGPYYRAADRAVDGSSFSVLPARARGSPQRTAGGAREEAVRGGAPKLCLRAAFGAANRTQLAMRVRTEPVLAAILAGSR
jgi:hypothetical protein